MKPFLLICLFLVVIQLNGIKVNNKLKFTQAAQPANNTEQTINSNGTASQATPSSPSPANVTTDVNGQANTTAPANVEAAPAANSANTGNQAPAAKNGNNAEAIQGGNANEKQFAGAMSNSNPSSNQAMAGAVGQLNQSNNTANPQFFDSNGNLLPKVMDLCKAYYIPTLNVTAKNSPAVSPNINSEAAKPNQNAEGANAEAANPQKNTEAGAQNNTEAGAKGQGGNTEAAGGKNTEAAGGKNTEAATGKNTEAAAKTEGQNQNTEGAQKGGNTEAGQNKGGSGTEAAGQTEAAKKPAPKANLQKKKGMKGMPGM